MRPHEGEPGDTAFVYGPTFRGEDWRYFPSDRLEIWWNTRVPRSQAPYEPIRPEPMIHLATVENMDGVGSEPNSQSPTFGPEISGSLPSSSIRAGMAGSVTTDSASSPESLSSARGDGPRT
jgi:hypothetical protein